MGGFGDAVVAGSASCLLSRASLPAGIVWHHSACSYLVKLQCNIKDNQWNTSGRACGFCGRRDLGSRLGGEGRGARGVLCSLQSCLCSPPLLPALAWWSLPPSGCGSGSCVLPRSAAEPHSQLKPPGVPQGGCSRLCSPRGTRDHTRKPPLAQVSFMPSQQGECQEILGSIPDPCCRGSSLCLPQTFPPPPQGMGTNG